MTSRLTTLFLLAVDNLANIEESCWLSITIARTSVLRRLRRAIWLMLAAGCWLLVGCSSVHTKCADYNGQTIRETWNKVVGITVNHTITRE